MTTTPARKKTSHNKDAKCRIRLTNPCHLLAVGFGSGLIPWLPGTAGTLAALPFWYLLSSLSMPVYWLLVVIAAVLGIYLCQRTSQDMGVHDHGSIVWDEFVGIWITLAVIPVNNWRWVLAGFLLFRVLDMWKPWPVGWFDRRVGGGFGIMLDDITAGVIAACLLYIAQWVIYH